MKVAINIEYGTFSLSKKAMQAIASRKGWQYCEGNHDTFWLKPTPNDEEQVWDTDLPRSDSDLVAVVEQLEENSWGRYSVLKIVDVPDEVNWHIQDYDGREWVAEDHRVWM